MDGTDQGTVLATGVFGHIGGRSAPRLLEAGRRDADTVRHGDAVDLWRGMVMPLHGVVLRRMLQGIRRAAERAAAEALSAGTAQRAATQGAER